MDYKLKKVRNYEHLEPDYTEEHEDPKDYCYGILIYILFYFILFWT